MRALKFAAGFLLASLLMALVLVLVVFYALAEIVAAARAQARQPKWQGVSAAEFYRELRP